MSSHCWRGRGRVSRISPALSPAARPSARILFSPPLVTHPRLLLPVCLHCSYVSLYCPLLPFAYHLVFLLFLSSLSIPHFWLPLMPLCSQLFYGAFCLQCLCVPLDSRCTSPFPVCVSRNSCRAFPHIRYKFMTDCLLAVVTTFETIDQSHIVFWCLWTVVVQHWVGSATCVAF